MKYFIHFILFYPFVLIDFWFELLWHVFVLCVLTESVWECGFIIFVKKIIKFENKDLEYIVFLSVKKIPSGRLTACWLLLVLCHLKK